MLRHGTSVHSTDPTPRRTRWLSESALKLPGVEVEEFERVDAAIDVRGNHPERAHLFGVRSCRGGWRVIDVWESRAHFDTFAAERIGPAAAAAGASIQPDIAEFPVHEYVSRASDSAKE